MSAQPGSVLLVDDDHLAREVLARFLERQGFTVTAVSDGIQALARIDEGGLDLVLLDVLMEGISGLDVLQRVRHTRPPTELPIIMASSLDEGRDVVEALRLGANDYVTKPFDREVVLARVKTHIAHKRAVERIVRLEQNVVRQNAELRAANQRMKRDLETAANVQAALLPPGERLTLAAAAFAWKFRPCTELAGDLLNVVALPNAQVALYVLDVSSHGAAAALLAAMVNRVLSLYQRDGLSADPDSGLAKMAAHLHQEFPRDPKTEQYFTLQYGILDLDSNSFRFVSAGHPGPAYLARDVDARNLKIFSSPIGMFDEKDVPRPEYEEKELPLAPGDRLFLYSDGLVDAFNSSNERFGVDRLLDVINRTRTLPLEDSVTEILHSVERWSSPGMPDDDISLLAVERTVEPGPA